MSAATRHAPADDRELRGLLVALTLSLFVVPPLTQAGLVGQWLAHLLFAGVVGAGALTAMRRRGPRMRVLVTTLVVGSLLAKAAATTLRTSAWQQADVALAAATIGVFAVMILRRVFSGGSITLARIEGAVAVYLLVGVLWALLYEWLALRDPSAFALPARDLAEADLTYFSFVTLTTVGYGDITPVSPVARSLAVGEALIGQLYPAVLIARLVSLEIAHRTPDS